MVSFTSLLSAVALSLTIAAPYVEAKTSRGLAWATDNRYAPTIGSGPQINWYHHWQDGIVSQMPSKVEWVPMMWGVSSSAWSNWAKRQSEMKSHKVTHLLSFNEPDISSQANMDPNYAAQVFMEQIMPYKWQGVKVGAPAIAWDIDWLDTFMNALWKKGGNVDFITVHWYGSWQDIAKFKSFVQTVHQRFGYKIWVTELGVTTASRPSASQVKSFMINAYNWMDSTGYVDRASWFGCFIESDPPDNYATGLNGLFNAAFRLSDLGYYYIYSASNSRRDLAPANAHVAARHLRIAARAAEEAREEDAVHCDELCHLREGSTSKWANAQRITAPANVTTDADDLD